MVGVGRELLGDETQSRVDVVQLERTLLLLRFPGQRQDASAKGNADHQDIEGVAQRGPLNDRSQRVLPTRDIVRRMRRAWRMIL